MKLSVFTLSITSLIFGFTPLLTGEDSHDSDQHHGNGEHSAEHSVNPSSADHSHASEPSHDDSHIEDATHGHGIASLEDMAETAAQSEVWNSLSPMERAAFYQTQGDFILAERTYIQLLEANTPSEKRKEILIRLADLYVERGSISRAVDALESCLRNYPEIAERPEVLFRLGQLYREMGLLDDSIAIFYRVLNAIVVTGESNLEKYLSLARIAQFEIARNHYESEAYDQANMLFERIELLELNPVDQETVSYFMTLSAMKSGFHEKALTHLRTFIERFPMSDFLPEMLYLEAEVLYNMRRPDASADALMRLLERSGTPGENEAGKWVFWRQKAGNKLANRFYDDGDYMVAIRLYQGMVALDESPAWQLPLIYQIALCFEKLSLFERAKESYDYISQEFNKLEEGDTSLSLQNIADSVRWRMEIIEWRGTTVEKMQDYLSDSGPSQNPSNSDT